MNVFDNIKKRKHVLKYDLSVDIPRVVIEQILSQAWAVTPSKQNVMPYRISVLGPDKQKEKDIVYKNVVKNHFRMEDEALEEGKLNSKTYIKKVNPYYHHIKENSYTLIFSCRLHKEVNKYYKKEIEIGHFMEQCDEERVSKGRDIDAVALETGLFVNNLTHFACEKDIDVSYTICFTRDMEDWKELSFIEYRPLVLVSMGKAWEYRGYVEGDTKTDFNEIVKWI